MSRIADFTAAKKNQLYAILKKLLNKECKYNKTCLYRTLYKTKSCAYLICNSNMLHITG